MQIQVAQFEADEMMEKVSNYSFVATALCMIFVYYILN